MSDVEYDRAMDILTSARRRLSLRWSDDSSHEMIILPVIGRQQAQLIARTDVDELALSQPFGWFMAGGVSKAGDYRR